MWCLPIALGRLVDQQALVVLVGAEEETRAADQDTVVDTETGEMVAMFCERREEEGEGRRDV